MLENIFGFYILLYSLVILCRKESLLFHWGKLIMCDFFVIFMLELIHSCWGGIWKKAIIHAAVSDVLSLTPNFSTEAAERWSALMSVHGFKKQNYYFIIIKSTISMI